ncbi:hypothetical protein VM1G_02332 [Cytospora mali]|uniref:Uncharacterized protein n=1 Tax=Cytospora mali TaxID=578113 RepID=A0A194VPD1_CYTMA|nr:hypothetical protein VM1G_02332 [Valsa mali]
MSPSTTATQDDADKPAVPPTELKFFLFSDPTEAKSRDNKRLVRSHVARTSHARSRHARASQRDVAQKHEWGEDLLADDEEPTISSVGEQSSSPASSTSLASSSTAPQNSPSNLPSNPPTLINSGAQDQLQAFVQHLSPWEQFLFDHYVTVLIPSRHNPCDHPSHPIDVSWYHQGMVVHWVSFCLTDVGLLQGLFLASCRNLAKIHRNSNNLAEADIYEQRALHYRGECLRSMRDSMPGDGNAVTDYTVGKALFLAFNEYMAENLDESKRHMAACEDLVELMGGHHALGLNGFMSQLILWFKQELLNVEDQDDTEEGSTTVKDTLVSDPSLPNTASH